MSKGFFADVEKNRNISEILQRRLEKYGELHYAYGVMNKRNADEMIIISDMPDDVVDNYLNEKYQNIDPVIINALSRLSPFSWDESLMINSQWTVSKIFQPVKPYNIINGYAFVLHDQNNNLVVLSLLIDSLLMSETESNIRMHKDEIQGVLIYIHEMLLNLYQNRNEIAKNALSSRETEVLYWSSTGKTYSEVANILQITVSTVKFHMANIVKKMGVKNAKHAISLGNELNIVFPPLKK
ncbi:LuxR family transcriptional regulator [Erwiniaceae bacterium BAC15a-03b]|uniref:LuxR family transcriptional regulator n=1 Tax=Winslowiella arboricola TaxID=2978220 RepID=A0A9J6PKF2_9GAMM|nr:LuxR family transcriptional regulator [Winslowiella arboricola]MCU5773202.1 LuxR family transcriptional regulator [Winslowiella arboricola]MCU5778785.1 LuxR family transcriptional regulator [Winslowiella arboricola]